jgi:ABC-type multidrug transport system ATPase subunit
MKRIRYVEIENFKTFGKKIHIDLDHPAVLIGPNNAGKTSVIQALALWNRGIQAWYEKKGQRQSAGINRLNILEIPVSETRFFWNNIRVRRGNTPIKMTVNVGLDFEGKVSDCRLTFTQRDREVIYCRPCPETVKNEPMLAYGAGLRFNLLYPMSGIESEEPLVQEGRINVLMGQGQTAQVLRNLCYKVIENDKAEEKSNWASILRIMKRLFAVDLEEPQLNVSRGNLILKYRQRGVAGKEGLDISLAGRGLQQMLLILTYLYAHTGSVLLIEEPDAHLEILRQKQVYEILKEIAYENKSLVIIATHSEVILDDAVDTNLTLLINGEAVNLATQNDMKNALRAFGIDHYYKARIRPRILYVEGSTDLEMIKALAQKLKHDAAYDILMGELNYYYTQDTAPEDTLDTRLDRIEGAYINYKQHFYALKRFVPDFKGIAIFDSDKGNVKDEIEEDLAVVYWEEYELENYFITPEVILDFIKAYYDQAGGLFTDSSCRKMQKIIDRLLLADVFKGDKNQLAEFNRASKSLRRTLLKKQKMSTFTRQVFEEFAEVQNQPVLLKKGEFHRLIEHVQAVDIPKEVQERLDLLVKYLQLKKQKTTG